MDNPNTYGAFFDGLIAFILKSMALDTKLSNESANICCVQAMCLKQQQLVEGARNGSAPGVRRAGCRA